VQAVAAERVPLNTLKPHTPALNALARSDGALFDVPGCQRNTKTTIVT